MKVLLLSTFATVGGASRAASRLLEGLNTSGIKAQMFVQEKIGTNKAVSVTPRSRYSQVLVKLRNLIDLQPLYSLYPRRKRVPFSIHWLPGPYVSAINEMKPDIINLHWISGGFLNIGAVKALRFPMVWTLHDMWPFTGGCHYSGQCLEFIRKCGKCPVLASSHAWDLSRWNWRRKYRAWRYLNLTIVTPSKWLAEQARASSLFADRRIEVIPNGLDCRTFRPLDKENARKILGIPQDKKVVLFGCQDVRLDARKGFALLRDSIEKLKSSPVYRSIEFVVFGTSNAPEGSLLGFGPRFLGYLNDDTSLAMAYSAADLFVAPSLQDNLPNTVMESLACGTPCIAFNIGGMADMIEHKKCGYLAEAFHTGDFAKGILWALADNERWCGLSERARQKALTEFDFSIQSERYCRLFNDILNQKDRVPATDRL